MGWNPFRSSKAARPAAVVDPHVRWFGKLPTYADYYSSTPDADWVVEFNDWILKGFEVYHSRRRERGADARVPSAAGLLRLPKSQMTVLWAMMDFGGDMRGRPFPLCFYVGLSTELLLGPSPGRLAVALRILRKLADMRQEVIRFAKGPGRFEQTFGGRQVDLTPLEGGDGDDAWIAPAKALGLADWFSRVSPTLVATEADVWFSKLGEWGEAIAKLEGESFEPTLGFPLAWDISFEVQGSGWLRWLAGRMDLEARCASILFSKNTDGQTGRMTYLAQDAAARDFLLLTELRGEVQYFDDACALGAPGSVGAADAPAKIATAGPLPDSWGAFVEARP